ncbi:MAG: hypothetical protein JNJ73_03755 [Hyphomonadaceae bacterium]|nr:hypothetical protein [Hyphomonadaceae bacterium]
MRLTFMLAIGAAAGAAPIVACALRRTQNVLDTSAAWCGAPPQASGIMILGHCPACFVGLAAVAAAAALVGHISRAPSLP